MGLGRRGFTLIEVLVAIVIISIMAGYSISHVAGNLPKWRAQGAANELVTMIQKARAVSIKKNKWVLFSLAGVNSPPNSTASLYVDVNTSGTVDAGDDKVHFMGFEQRYKGSYVKSSVDGAAAAVTMVTLQPDGTVKGNTMPIVITVGSTKDATTYAVWVERSGIARLK